MTDTKINLPETIKFVNLLNKFRQVERMIHSNGGDRMENDVEHSYQLTMLAWYIISSNKLDLDLDLIIKYALVHDLVEVYAGDTWAYSDKSFRDGKQKREKISLDRLEKEFKEFPEIFELIKDYEKREIKEVKFVYALDKIEPILNIYTNNGKTWKEKGVTIDMVSDYKKDKIALSPELKKYFDELISLLKKKEKDLFNIKKIK